MVTAKRWTIKKCFVGAPKLDDFEIKEETLPALSDGEFLTEAIVWSVDPYNRIVASGAKVGDQMVGFQLAKVVESKSTKFPTGAVLMTTAGWRTHTVLKEGGADPVTGATIKRVDEAVFAKHPATYFVGALGMPGATAYFGVLEKLRPKAGETMVVNAASGAVGAIVGQIGKILGLNVVGYAGSSDKVAYLKSIGYDHAFNYKTQNLDETLKDGAPKGVDVFFDNVGFDFGVTVMNHMNMGGRICQCGAISGYNATEPKSVVFPYLNVIFKTLNLQGFTVGVYFHRYEEFISKMSAWIEEGKVKPKEVTYNGFGKMPQALIDVLSGAAEGKAVIVP